MKRYLPIVMTTLVRRLVTAQSKGENFRVRCVLMIPVLIIVVLIALADSLMAADLVNTGETSSIARVFVDKAATTTTVTSPYNPSTYTGGVLITVTVASAAPGGPQPTGNVKLFIDGVPYSSGVPLMDNNVVNFGLVLSGGLHSVSAKYLGDDDFAASEGTLAGGQMVNRSTLAYPIKSVSTNPTQAGEGYTVQWDMYVLIAELQAPTGNITVTDGSDICTAPVSAGSCVLISTTPGNKTLITSYQGDNNWNPAVSPGVAHSVLTSINGRVLSPDGTGIRNANVILTDAEGNSRAVPSSSLGFFAFDRISVGQTYTITVRLRRYRFEPQSLTVSGPVQNLVFTGIE